MITVAELPAFTRRADKLFDESGKRDLIEFLARNPLAGDEIPGTGGVRKLRYALSGKGKRGGARIVYYYFDDTMPLYALLAYGKGERTDLTPDEKRAASKLVTILKKTAKAAR